jgi:hypothetical protein
MNDLYEYIGCIHIHSIYSDGTGTYPEIIKSGREAGLDYLMFSDHMTLQGKEKGYNGWYDNLFVIIGYEIQDPQDKHHYLAFGLNEVLPENMTHGQYIKAVQEKNGLGIAAHPFEERDMKHSIPGYPPIPWGNLNYPEIEVIEVWNIMSHWLESTTLRNKYWNAIHPRSFSTFPKRNLLDWWDKINVQRKVTGIGSVDVHAKKVKIFGLFNKAIFDYKIMFKSIRTHLLLDRLLDKSITNKEIENIIYNAIKGGKSFISNYRRGDARGFRFWAEVGKKEIHMGDIGYSNDATLKIRLPSKELCKIIRNGNLYKSVVTDNLNIEVPDGIYRVEVEKDNRGWIYTNHIKIFAPRKLI